MANKKGGGGVGWDELEELSKVRASCGVLG